MPSPRHSILALVLALIGCTSGTPQAPPAKAPTTAEPESMAARRAPADLHFGPWIIDRYEAKHLRDDAARIALSLTSSGRFWVTDKELWVADGSERSVFARLAWEGPGRARIHRGETDGILLRASENELTLETEKGVLALHLIPFATSKVVQPLCLFPDDEKTSGYVARKPACAAPEQAFDPL